MSSQVTYNVPCRARYVPAAISRAGESMVTLQVGSGAYMRIFTIEERLLRQHSGHFDRRLLNKDREAERKCFVLPHENPGFFKLFVRLVDRSCLLHPNPIKATVLSLSARFLVNLFLFANAFSISILRNAAIDTFFLRIHVQPESLSLEHIPCIYKNTSEGSSIRDLMVNVVTATGSEDQVASSAEKLPDEYYEDLVGAVQDGSEKASDVSAWLEKRRSKICRYYHLHDEEDDTL